MLTAHTGAILSTGDMNYATATGAGYADADRDAGPSIWYQGDGLFDPRSPWGDASAVSGKRGVIPAWGNDDGYQTVEAVPAAFGAAKIAAAAHTTSGTAMTLVTSPAAGIAINVPVAIFAGGVNAGVPAVAPIVLDYGFAWVNCTSGSTTITVPDSTVFPVNMPLVIAHVGNSGGTAALLTWVTGQPSATTITVNDAPQATNSSTPVGTGNIWGPREGLQSNPYPTGALPFLAGGCGLFLDPRQSLARGVSITCNNASGTGGAFVVAGWDIYGQPMTETITITPSSALEVYGKKAFKAIASVTPGFSDATYTYSVGTSDVFGFGFRSDEWEYMNIYWAGAMMTASTGWTAWAEPASGDVRGTVQVSANGGGSGIGSNSSNGSVSSNVMTGRRLAIFQQIPVYNMLRATPLAPQFLVGATQT